jgi:GntR family transcriptional regulator / MocR family aminotransferase
LNRRRGFLVPSVVLDRTTGEALHRQIARQLADAIRSGSLAAEARLPSTRLMARMLQVSRNSVVAAYDELVAAGLIRALPGSGVRVNATAPLSTMPLAGTHRLIDDARFPANVVQIEDEDSNSLYIRY